MEVEGDEEKLIAGAIGPWWMVGGEFGGGVVHWERGVERGERAAGN